METLKIGDRVRRRQFPHIKGTVWDMPGLYPDWVNVKWDDPEEQAQVPGRDLEKITPGAKRRSPGRAAPTCARATRLQPYPARARSAATSSQALSKLSPWPRPLLGPSWVLMYTA